MLLTLAPLLRRRELRLLYFGEFASALGSMLTVVALPYQIFHLTRSSLAVGLIGLAQLVPLLLSSLVGGAFADATDRRRLLLSAELVLLACTVTIALNSLSPHPRLWLLYVVAAIASAANGFHGPTLQAMMPRLVPPEEIPTLGALNSLKGTAGAVAGPVIGGLLISQFGLATTYWIDALSFLLFVGALLLMRPMPASEPGQSPSLRSIGEGLRYAAGRQDLIGTYVVDIVAMVFGMPMALFPEIAENFGGAAALGWLYTAPSAGAFLAALVSGWTHKVTRHGAAIAIAAVVWGAAITAFGFCTWFPLALFFLTLAGGADMISGLFRQTIWNTTIPDAIRGRLAGIEMLSYMSGPLLGNAESGLVSALAGTQFAIVSGGLLCIAGVYLCIRNLPLFLELRFQARTAGSSVAPRTITHTGSH